MHGLAGGSRRSVPGARSGLIVAVDWTPPLRYRPQAPVTRRGHWPQSASGPAVRTGPSPSPEPPGPELPCQGGERSWDRREAGQLPASG